MAVGVALLLVLPVTLHVAVDLAPAIVERATREAGAIWHDAGVELEWQAADRPPRSLRVEFGDARGRGGPAALPLAWIGFVNATPNEDIYVSRGNVRALLDATGVVSSMPAAAANVYLGRALGRALAHEIGHYLFRSTGHDAKGVMATRRAPAEFFGPDRTPFLLTLEERTRLTIVLERDRVAGEQRGHAVEPESGGERFP